MDADHARERILTYMRASAQALADEWQPHELGFSLTSPTLPRVWVLNRLVVDAQTADPQITAEELAGHGRRLMLEQGRSHARVTILDRALGEALAPGFRDLGWDVAQNLMMVDSGADHAESGGPGVEAEPSPRLDELLAEVHRENFYGDDPEAVEQLRELDRRSARRLDGKAFVAPAGDPGALAELRQLGGVGEIDFVQTLEARRGEGLARAVMHTVLAASRAANELTFLEADAEDWPHGWYARLGFEVVGSDWELDLSI
jgi:hypothetical protein